MSEVHPEFGRLMTAEQYAKEWEENSSHFEKHGYYALPLERLGKPKAVMEIGCGSGRSTLALAKKGHRVVAVEINEPAARSAHEFLSGHGISTDITGSFPNGSDESPDAPQVTIVVGDVFAEGALPAGGDWHPEAVLCWFIGAQLDVIAAFFGKSTMDLTSDDVRKYRLSLQAKCYEIGRRILRKGGIVQVADRMRLASWQDKDFAREEQAQTQAGLAGPDYSISRSSTFLARVSGGFEGSAIQYLTQNAGAQVRVVTSVIATLG